MTPATAERTAQALPQHMTALQRANEVRLARAELKRCIGAGTVKVHTVILRPPWEAETMTIAELLCSQRRWGTTRASKLCAGLGIPETKTLQSFTERQRSLLAKLV